MSEIDQTGAGDMESAGSEMLEEGDSGLAGGGSGRSPAGSEVLEEGDSGRSPASSEVLEEGGQPDGGSPEAVALLTAARKLATVAGKLHFADPVAMTYNPLEYAWEGHADYVSRWGAGQKRVVFLGMNPGPFGMAQTGVPFGEIAAVRDWMGVRGRIGHPPQEHPKRPVQGFACPKSEVSGRRLWGLMQQRFGDAGEFFRDHFVVNYCPLIFMEASSRNRTPNQLKKPEREALFAVCDQHLQSVLMALQPEWVVGVGKFAAERAARVVQAMAGGGAGRANSTGNFAGGETYSAGDGIGGTATRGSAGDTTGAARAADGTTSGPA